MVKIRRMQTLRITFKEGRLNRGRNIGPGSIATLPLRGKSTSSSTESPRLPHRVVMERGPGSDEHQLVRGAAGEPAHRATRHTTLFAPGAGAPTTEFARRSTALGAIGCAGD